MSELTDRQLRWHRRIKRLRHPAWLGTLRRTSPLSSHWGFERGTPIDRYYIEQFLDSHRTDITGHVLEIKDSEYADQFGTDVTRCDVLDVDPQNAHATIIADLADAPGVASDQFDCFILTQTLQFIYDAHAAVRNAYRILRPGGVLLLSVPVVSRLATRYGLEGDFWRFTPASCNKLFGDVFGSDHITVQAHGNVLTGISFLAGMAREELSIRELETHDPYFPLLITVRAAKWQPKIGRGEFQLNA